VNEEPKIYRAGTLTYTKAALALLFFWLLWGDFCYFLVETVVPSIIPLKLKSLGASTLLIGVVLATIPRTISTICNPVISLKSDRFRSRWGRRIPFITVTMPFLVLCFLGLAFTDDIAQWLHMHLTMVFRNYSVTTITLFILCVLLVAFDFFNSFVTSVFWYLFNDVVPDKLLSRFMSWFRMVIMATGALYNLFIFKHAKTHYKEIFIGAALLYFFGFGAMCLNVKEGEYPPPQENTDKRRWLIRSVKSYARQCMTLPHYWYLFLATMFLGVAGACAIFNIFFQTISMGLSLEQVGRLGFAGAVASAVYMPVSGWLADRYHPIRVVMVAYVLSVLITPIGLIWLFWHPGPTVFFYFTLIQTIFISCPVGMLAAMMDPPLLMKIFPRAQYGQFSSAKAMLGSVTGIFSGALGGLYLKVLTHFFGERTAYCLIPLWVIVFQSIAVGFIVMLYRSWLRYGGDESYVAPLPKGRGIPAEVDNIPAIIIPAGAPEL